MEAYKISSESMDDLYYTTYQKALKTAIGLVAEWEDEITNISIEDDSWTIIIVKGLYHAYQIDIEKIIIND